MARVLVVYYSRTGTTKGAAVAIADALAADLEPIVDRGPRTGLRGYVRSAIDVGLGRRTEIDPATRKPGDYDLVVVGSPSWSASISSPARAYIIGHRGELGAVAFFCTCGASGGEHVLRQMAHLARRGAVSTLVLHRADVSRGAIGPAVHRFARSIRVALGASGPSNAVAPPTGVMRAGA